MRAWILPATLFAVSALPLFGQLSDSCNPGWSMLNQLREQLTSDTPAKTLELLYSKAETRLRLCPRDIPDLWYYRYLIAQKLNKKDDYALTKATDLRSPALAEKANPFTATAAAPSNAPLSKTVREKWALVVGIGQFVDKDHVPALQYTVNDATAFASLLADPKAGRFKKDNIIQLVDNQATLLGIRTAIGQLREKVKEDDLLVVYMASHGSPRESDPNGVSYVITYDTRLDSAANLYATSLQMIDLVQLLRRDIRAQRLALILDTCFSGDAAGARGVTPYGDPAKVGPPAAFSSALEGFANTGARVVISASRGDQQSWESPQLKHGYFTYFLLDALRQNEGKIALEQAFTQARDQTQDAVWKDHQAKQAPAIQKSDQGGSISLGAETGN